MFFNTCHLLDYFFCGQQSMRMLFICGESPIFSDQIGIKIIAVRGGSNEYPQYMFWSKNKKNRYTPANPIFTI